MAPRGLLLVLSGCAGLALIGGAGCADVGGAACGDACQAADGGSRDASPSADAPPGDGPCGFLPADASTVLLYHFEDGSGATLSDDSGHRRDGSLHGPDWTAGRFGGGLQFADGDQDEVQIASSFAWPGSTVTFEAWIRQEDSSSVVLSTDTRSVQIRIDDHQLVFSVGDGDAWQSVTASTIPAMSWHHVAGTFDGAKIRAYLDGEKVDAHDASVAIASSGSFVIGGADDGGHFSGVIDEVRVSSVARSGDEIAAYYAAASACTEL